MPRLSFHKWSPCGNSTLLFPAAGLAPGDQSAIASLALKPDYLGGEQAGFVEERGLRMAGGEFCVNAVRAFGAQLAMTAADAQAERRDFHCEVTVSGWPTPVSLMARGEGEEWLVAATLRLPECPLTRPGLELALVRMPGICHLLVDAPAPASPEERLAAAARLRQEHGLDREPACGVIWCVRAQEQWSIVPVVHVRDVSTDVMESACGSGSLALGLALRADAAATQRFSILQPSGEALDIVLGGESGQDAAVVAGEVRLTARGEIWIPDAAILAERRSRS